jgi:predicted deacetylase
MHSSVVLNVPAYVRPDERMTEMEVTTSNINVRAQLQNLLALQTQLRRVACKLQDVATSTWYFETTIYNRGRIAGRQRWVDKQLKKTEKLLAELMEKEGTTHASSI